MSLKITHKNSTSAGTPPAAGDIDVGEIAINAADAELYIKDNVGNIRKFQNTTTGTADGVQFTQTGISAVQRTVESKLQDVVSVLDFIPPGTDTSTTDCTTFIQAAINAAQGKSVYFPAGTYLIETALTSSGSGQVLLRGDGLYRSILKWGSSSAGVFIDAGVWGLDLREITLSGVPTGGDFWRAGDTGIKTTGVLSIQNSRLIGFETLIDWDGGYYHKFSNSIFTQCSVVIATANANNLQFSQCRFYRFINGISYNGGSGPIVISQCSVEFWTGTFIQSTAGAASAVAIQGSYFENYPNDATTSPMAAGFYDSGIVCNALDTLTVSGCNVSLKGIRRFLNASGSLVSNLTSTGNRFNYSSGSQATCQHIYFAGSFGSLLLNDWADDNLAETGGSYTTSYRSGTIVNAVKSSGYDAITGNAIGVTAQVANKPDYEEGTWVPVMSGSGGSAGTFSAVSLLGNYIKVGNKVTAFFRLAGGITDLGSWSGDVRISLPFAADAPNPVSLVAPVAVRIYGSAGQGYIGRVDDGDSFFRIFKYPGGAAVSPETLQWSDLTTAATGFMLASITYIAA